MYKENKREDENPRIKYHEIRNSSTRQEYHSFSDDFPKYFRRSFLVLYVTLAVFQIYMWLSPTDSTWKKFGLILLGSFGMYISDLLVAEFSFDDITALAVHIFLFDISFIYILVTSGLLIYNGKIHVLLLSFLVAVFHYAISILFIKYSISVIILVAIISYFMRSIKFPISLASLLMASSSVFYRISSEVRKVLNIIGITILLTIFPDFFHLGPGAITVFVIYCVLIAVTSAL